MTRYTDSIVAAVRQRYENTNQTLHSIAAEFQISTRNLSRMAAENGWTKRSERVQGLPVAMQLLEQAKALAAVTSPPPERGRSDCEAVREGVKQEETPSPTLPLAGGGSPPAPAEGGEQEATPTPILPLAGGGNLSAIDRIEQLVLKEIEAEETARAELGGKQRAATAGERCARTLATLTQTLHALQRLRAGALPEQETLYDDDMPSDIDEFRRDLARRIDAFVASRTDAADAEGNSGAAPVDEVR